MQSSACGQTSQRETPNRMSSEEQSYRQALTNAADVALKRHPDTTEQFFRELRGAFPTEVIDLLPKLKPRVDELRQPAEKSDEDILGQPEPHPIDYDWRFTAETAESVANLIGSNSNILCLGTPTIFQVVGARGHCAHLVDQNPLLPHQIPQFPHCTVETSTVANTLQSGRRFSTVILDPPWYPTCYDQWISIALSRLSRPGIILVSLFRDLTRPDALSERKKLLANFAAIGRTTIIDQLTYSTPRFEHEVLSRAGLPNLGSWRAADLVRIEVAAEAPGVDVNLLKPSAQRGWQRFLIGNQVVAVKTQAVDDGPISYVEPGGRAVGTELRSVSRRDTTRRRLTVWTSRNRAVIATGTFRISALLSRISKFCTYRPENILVSAADRKAFQNLCAVLDIRNTEYD